LLVLLGQNFVFAVIFKALDFVGEDLVNDLEGEKNYQNFGVGMRAFTQVWDLMLGDNDYRVQTPLGLVFWFLCTLLI
jgi:hypothetical protein